MHKKIGARAPIMTHQFKKVFKKLTNLTRETSEKPFHLSVNAAGIPYCSKKQVQARIPSMNDQVQIAEFRILMRNIIFSLICFVKPMVRNFSNK